MAATKYDKSKIMQRAWYIYNRSYMSFAEALRESWKRAKDEAKAEEQARKSFAEFDRRRGAYSYHLNRAYYGSKGGRDDWVRTYQNDVKVAVKRAGELGRMR